MKTWLIAAIASAFAVAAAAQTPTPLATQLEKCDAMTGAAKDACVADAKAKYGTQTATDAKKAKQEMVKGTTESATKAEGAKAAAGSAEAAKTKDMAKTVSKDKASRQQAVKSVTEQTAGTGYGAAAAQGSAKAAADASPRKEKPKPKLDSPAMKEASKP